MDEAELRRHVREARRLTGEIRTALKNPHDRARALALAESLTGYCRVIAKKSR